MDEGGGEKEGNKEIAGSNRKSGIAVREGV